jgi:hypothetical protein
LLIKFLIVTLKFLFPPLTAEINSNSDQKTPNMFNLQILNHKIFPTDKYVETPKNQTKQNPKNLHTKILRLCFIFLMSALITEILK